MNSLAEKKQEILNFWDIRDEGARDKLLDEIREYADSIDSKAFAAELRANFEQYNYSGIGVVYEALTKNPEKWSLFFKEEYQRAFVTAEKSNNPGEVLECLRDMVYVEEQGVKSKDEIIQVLESYLYHESDVMRYYSVWLLNYWLPQDNPKSHPMVRAKVLDRLKDKNWRIRYITTLVLKDLKSVPEGFKLGFMDQLRVRFLSPFDIK